MTAVGRGHIMDMITEGLLAEFSKEFQIEALQEDKRFEHLCGFIVVKRHYSETFDPPTRRSAFLGVLSTLLIRMHPLVRRNLPLLGQLDRADRRPVRDSRRRRRDDQPPLRNKCR
jgi:hypothetical protein